ncbi:hypothetical protein O0L34_g17700 [Tuta absoluta]|nr:hypothetical protein O0L34_g17700 [Tuta absoluta]
MKDVNLEYVTEEWNNILNEIDRFASPRVEQLYKKIISAFQVYNWIYRSVVLAGFDTTLPIMDSSRSYDDGQNIALLLINAYEKTAELYSTTSADKLTSIPGQTRFIIITDRNRGRALSLLRKALGKTAQN